MRNRDMPANANDAHPQDFSGPTTVQFLRQYKDGLTKREEAALAAMQGICSNPNFMPVCDDNYKNAAEDAVRMADALFDELDGEEE